MVRAPRRRILQTGLAGILPFSGASTAEAQPEGKTTVQGQVMDLSKNSVEGAQVTFHDPDAFTEGRSSQLTSTETDSEGQFEATLTGSYEQVLYICRQNDWFRIVTAAAGPSQGIVLNRELLFGPTVAEDDGSPLGVATIWRQIGSNSSHQVIFMEVTNTNAAPADDNFQITGRTSDLSDGWFSLSFPQNDVEVDYGSHTSVEIPISGPVNIWASDTPVTDEPHPLTALHPIRTDLPITEMGQVNYYDLGRPSDEIGDIQRGLGMLLSAHPTIATAMVWKESVQWFIGDSIDMSGHIGLNDVSAKDPNTTDTVFESWQSDNNDILEEASVVLGVPIRIPGDSEVGFSAEAEWTMSSSFGVGDLHGSLATEFALGHTSEISGENQDLSSKTDIANPFQYLVNPAHLRTEDAVFDQTGSSIRIQHPRALFNSLSEEIQGYEAYAPNLITIGREITNQDHEAVLTNVRGESGILTTAYDATEDELIAGLEAEGFSSADPNVDARGWSFFEGKVDFGDLRNTSSSILVAVNGNKTITAPKFLENRQRVPARVIRDKETAMDIALATFEGDLKSYSEADIYGSSILGEFIQYKNNPSDPSTAGLVANAQDYGLKIRVPEESDWEEIDTGEKRREEIKVGEARFSRFEDTQERRTTMPILGDINIRPSVQEVESFDLA